MSLIANVPPSQADAEVAAAYQYLGRVAGTRIPARIFRVFGHRPATMVRFIRNWELALWVGSEPRSSREMVAVAVSSLASCAY